MLVCGYHGYSGYRGYCGSVVTMVSMEESALTLQWDGGFSYINSCNIIS